MIAIEDILSKFPTREPDCHKHQVGKVAIVAGSLSMMGAAILTAKAALRSGAGLVYLLTISEACLHINCTIPEIITIPLPSKEGVLTEDAHSDIMSFIKDKQPDVLAIGPGLGRKEATQSLIRSLLDSVHTCPLVIDADALHVLNIATISKLKKGSAIVTPHEGEFKSIFGKDPKKEPVLRESFVKDACNFCKQVVVLKGAGTAVASPGKYYENENGNPGMAVGGSGDVLTGIITALVSQKMPLFEAAAVGVWIHGEAGDMAFEDFDIGLIPSDIIDLVPDIIKSIEYEK